MITVQQVVNWLNEQAPLENAESFDNVGLLLGDPQATVHSVLFGMDITEPLVEEAIRLKANLIITHHPFIFHGLKRIDYTTPQGRSMCRLFQNHIAVIAAHTNWDQATGGVGDSLAQTLELRDVISGDAYVRIGMLSEPMLPDAFCEYVQDKLRILPRLYFATDKPILRVAVAGGAYGEGYSLAQAMGADAYVVGEIAHHEILDACARGLTICDAGHFATEWPGVVSLYQRFLSDVQRNTWNVHAHLHTVAPYPGAILA